MVDDTFMRGSEEIFSFKCETPTQSLGSKAAI
jgi:hypothetical protein